MDGYVLGISAGCKSEEGLRQFIAKYGHRYMISSQSLICKHCGLPLPLQLSRDQGLTQTCAFKEFRFEPPYVSKKKYRKKKKLPPIPEHMLPQLHNSFEEEDDEYDEVVSAMPTLPSISISPAFITERVGSYKISYVDILVKLFCCACSRLVGMY